MFMSALQKINCHMHYEFISSVVFLFGNFTDIDIKLKQKFKTVLRL